MPRFARFRSYAGPVREVETGVLREMIKDQAALGRHTIPVPTLLRRLGLDEPLEEARAQLRAVLEQIESDEQWRTLMEVATGRQLLRLRGGVMLAEVVLNGLLGG